MTVEHFRSAELVFGWCFLARQEAPHQRMNLLKPLLPGLGIPIPRLEAWEKGERLATLIADHRNLLILDGLEPLQYPPGPQEGRLREASLQALLE